MPIGAYFKGSGEKVMKNMQDEYGAEKGKRVFYATANKKGEKPNAKSAGRRLALGRMK
jgi:hypothetical protein